MRVAPRSTAQGACRPLHLLRNSSRRALRAARPSALLVDSPLPLALLRIVVPLVIVVSPQLALAQRLAASPELLGFVPEGLGVIAKVPLSPQVVRVLQVLAFSSAATAMLGYFSRASMLVLTLSAGLVFTLSQRQGAVVHDMHLFWMTALLAASPCGDAWSLDAWGKQRPARSMRYGVPLMAARVLLGLVYFFPGLHKLRASGLAWMTSANVLGHMHAKWLEHGIVPLFRIDHFPELCGVGAVLVLTFELSFLFMAIVPRTRILAAIAGLVFHVSTQLFFFITFTSLWACYVVLLDGERLERVERRLVPERARGGSAERTRVGLAVGLAITLITAVMVQGIRDKTQAWPFACYPTFEHVQGDTIPDIVVEVAASDGHTLRLTGREKQKRSQAEWGRVFRISGAYGEPLDEHALRLHARSVVEHFGVDGITIDRTAPVRLYRVAMPTAPERWSEVPRDGVLLTELSRL
jgi:hypothetical protein